MTPGYWMFETSGVLKPVVQKFINGGKLDATEVATMRAYVRQWMTGDFQGAEAEQLRAWVDEIVDHESLTFWLGMALAAGIDPL